MKIVTIVGARPQFIKAGALSREIRKSTRIEEILVHTGQHYDENMSDIFFEQMQIPVPKYNLSVKSSRHGQMTGQMIERIEDVLFIEKPDVVIVYGDTNSTIAGALAAKKLHIKVAHIEAGLRSFNLLMPEEINRILTDRISDLLFCPSEHAVANLKKEGFDGIPCRIHDVGDIMKDVALFYKGKGMRPSIDLPDAFLLATLHRAENTDNANRLKAILEAYNRLAGEIEIILPLHPRSKMRVSDYGFSIHPNLHIVDPVGYLEMVYLLERCKLVVTDSGGLQKEAYYFGKFCVTTRDETEWAELVESGYNALTGADTDLIVNTVSNVLKKRFSSGSELYGDGKTSEKIISALLTSL